MSVEEQPYPVQDGPATLRTIADLAGVSPSTVSRVLHPSANTVGRKTAAATAARIQQVAREIGYVPNPHAASLRTQRSSLIGVLVPQLADLVLALIYEGIEDAASELRFGTFVANTHDDPATQQARAEMMLNRRVDGLVLGDARVDGTLAADLRRRGVPYVLTNRRVDGHPSVTCDDALGGRLVAEHLLSLGHTKVAVAAGAAYASTGIDRSAGFLDAYAAAGHPVPADLVVHSPFDVGGGRRAAEQLLATQPELTAIFAVNDFAAIGAMGAIRDAGRQVGGDMALVGYNDVPLVAELPVPLTTVRSPMREMGYAVVQLLKKRLDGLPVEAVRLPPTLMARASTVLTAG
jgi:LacI family transcriptional regulator